MSVVLAPARMMDGGAVASILSASVDQARAWMPRVYTRAEELVFADQMIAAGWVTVARFERDVIGFSALRGSEVLALYVAPGAQGAGVGKTLLSAAKDAAGEAVTLWSYQANTRAARFYKREGFREVERTTGGANELGLPDIRFEWKRSR